MVGRVTASQIACASAASFLPFDVGIHVARRHQLDLTAQQAELTGPIVRAGAGLDTDQARRMHGEELEHLRSPDLPAHHHLTDATDAVHLEHRLGNIQTDRNNWPMALSSCSAGAYRSRGGGEPSTASLARVIERYCQGQAPATVSVSADEGRRRCLGEFGEPIYQVGLAAGTLTQHPTFGLTEAGHEMVCMEARQVNAALSAMRNKTDNHDARGIARILRSGWYSRMHVKSVESHHTRALLTCRNVMQRKCIDL